MDETTIEATFCFVDIAGYTALTDTHGELAAADLVDDFAALIRTSVEPLGHLQSLVGDCAFFVFSDPIVAKNALLALYSSIADRQNFPVVRAGLHHGSALIPATALRLDGKHCRSRGRASHGRTDSVHEVRCRNTWGADVHDVEVKPQGHVSLRNLADPMELFEVVIGSSRQYAIDPVCKMQVDKQRAVGDLLYNNKKYWFCSLYCVERFARRPTSYT